ncbi:sulfurtransferase TusA family protein [Labrys neptuniae]
MPRLPHLRKAIAYVFHVRAIPRKSGMRRDDAQWLNGGLGLAKAIDMSAFPPSPPAADQALHSNPALRSNPASRIDLRGLKCPLPVLRAQKELARLAPGDRLILECTDPMAAIDLPNLMRETGDIYEGRSEEPGFTAHHIRKAPTP